MTCYVKLLSKSKGINFERKNNDGCDGSYACFRGNVNWLESEVK
jgi:hypothetical protein